ncbi:MAG: hypothetical protein ABI321_18985 [Polyangia bacterium]
MKRHVLCLSLLATGAAQASETAHYSLFTHTAHEEDRDAEQRIVKVVTACGYSEMSRMGPSEAQRQACRSAERRAVELGSRAAQAAIDRVDDEGVMPSVRQHLYSVVGRAGDTRFIEPLVQALEREDRAGLGNARHYERQGLASALTAITYAAPKGTPAIQWRAWADAHKDRTRAELLDDRLAEVEATLKTGTVAERAAAAGFLASRTETRTRGMELLQQLAKESHDDADHRSITDELARVPEEHATHAGERPRS